jgi:hypothetical protein
MARIQPLSNVHCRGTGELSRNEILDRLGVKDFARVAKLSAEEAFRVLQNQYRQDGDALWARFQTELTRRIGAPAGRKRT